MVRRWGIAYAALVLLLVIVPASAFARPITIVWDPNPGPEAVRYVLYYGTQSGLYTDSVEVGSLTVWQLDLPGDQYYFAVQAIDIETGDVSPLSAELAESSVIELTNPGNQSDTTATAVSLLLATRGSPVAYSAIHLPDGLGINASTGLISGTVSVGAGAPSPYFVTAVVSDAGGNTSSVQFTWTIVEANRPPTLIPPGNQTSVTGIALVLPIVGLDPDNNLLTFSADGLPAGLTIDPSSGWISGTIAPGVAGLHAVTVTVSDGVLATSALFSWTVTAATVGDGVAVDQVVVADGNGLTTTPPFSTSQPGETVMAFVSASGRAGDLQTTTVTGGGLSWSLVARVNGQSGTAEIWTAAAASALQDVEVTSTPGVFGFMQSLTVVTFTGAGGTGAVAGASGPVGAPSVSLAPTRAGSLLYAVGFDWDFPIARVLGANQTMVHEWVSTATSETFWVQKLDGQIGSAGTAVSLNDTSPADDQWNFAAVEILAARPAVINRAPTLTMPETQTSAEHANVSLALMASDPDGDRLTYRAHGLPRPLTIDAATGVISGIVSYRSAGTYLVTVAVSDGHRWQRDTFTWVVTNVNRPPVLRAPVDQTSAENRTISLRLVARDPDGDAVTYSAAGLPPSLTLDATTGVISGVLSYTSAGSYQVTATASDGHLSDTETFTWTVVNVNRRPTLTPPANQTSAENKTISLRLVAKDPDGDGLTYSAVGLPPSLTINAATGLISGILSSTSAGMYQVTATVSDGRVSQSATFMWTVADVNRPPALIATENQIACAGTMESLTIVASDPDGDALTFFAAGLPHGLRIDAASGVIDGVPDTAGSSRVTVTVSDGRLSKVQTFTWTITRRR